MNMVGRDQLIVELLSDEDEWENFVATSPQGTFYHTLKWKRVLEMSFPVEALYLAIRGSNRALVGVCPFIIRKELKVIKVLDSLPYSDYGGPLVMEEYAEPAMGVLLVHLKQLAHEKSIAYARIRFSDKNLSQYYSAAASRVDTSTGTMMLDLQEQPTDYLWEKVFTQKASQRTYIRRFEKDGFENMEVESVDDLNMFYTLYYRNMNHIGGLTYAFNFFTTLWDSLYSDYFNIILTRRLQQCIGAEAFFTYRPKNIVYQTCIGIDRSVGTQYRVYYYLNWGLIKWAEKEGYRYVSFGSTPSDSQEAAHSLKSKFGAEFNQDYYVYLPFNRKLFLMREMVAKIWGKIGTRLPMLVRSKLMEKAYAR